MDSAGKSCEGLTDDGKPEEEDARQCNPSLPVEMEIDADKMRGDAIGNTLYSECWVLKILLKLSKFNSQCWSKDVEIELCLLWDMTIEPDVVELLMEHNFLELATDVIRETTVPRLTEILVGIIGNICCIPSVREKLASRRDLICHLLGLLSLPDVPTLLQLMRLIQTCAWDLRGSESNSLESLEGQDGLKGDNCDEKDMGNDLNVGASSSVAGLEKSKCTEIVNIGERHSVEHHDPKESSSKSCVLQRNDCGANLPKSSSDGQLSQKALELPVDVTENLWKQELMDLNKWLPNIIFILNSSTNDQLLCSVLSLLDTLCYIPVTRGFLGNYLAGPALVMALVETLDQLDREYRTDDRYPNGKLRRAACHWVSVLSAFTSFSDGRAALGTNARALNTGLCRHLSMEYLDDPLHEEQAQFIMLSVTVVGALLLDIGYFHPKTFNRLLAILASLRGKLCGEVEEAAEEEDTTAREIEKEVLDSLEQYFEAVVEWADEELLNRVYQRCDAQYVVLLKSFIKPKSSK